MLLQRPQFNRAPSVNHAAQVGQEFGACASRCLTAQVLDEMPVRVAAQPAESHGVSSRIGVRVLHRVSLYRSRKRQPPRAVVVAALQTVCVHQLRNVVVSKHSFAPGGSRPTVRSTGRATGRRAPGRWSRAPVTSGVRPRG